MRAELSRAGVAPSAIRTFDDVERAFAAARDDAGEADRIVVFGSFLTVAAALAAATPSSAHRMAERIADNAELIVDEMKRKARRRLVGAVVLALAAAIVLPMLLEKEPQPLGDDVSVQIPPVDEGKFVNRLTGKTGDAQGAAKPTASRSPTRRANPKRKADARAEAGAAAPPTERAKTPKP